MGSNAPGMALPPKGIAMKHDQVYIAYQGHSTTSERAAQQIAGSVDTMRRMILASLQAHGPMSDEQLQIGLSINPSTERPRRIELCKLGLVRDSGLTGKTRSGRACTLWVASTPSEDQGRLF